MQGYLLSRLVQTIITLFVVSLVVFFLVRLRGDPVTAMAPPTFNQQQIEALRTAWGLDEPLWHQYGVFISRAVTGDFGQSRQYNRSAMGIVIERLQWTLLLAASASILGLIIALPLGVISALKRNSIIDLFATGFATLGTAMPSFWVGLMLILLFSVQLRMLPAFGADSWKAVIMPTIALGTGMAARISRLTRSSMLEVLGQDYIRTARSKGLAHRIIVWRHALRNAMIPVLTAFGLQLGWLLGGTVTVEVVFAWPGVGRLMVDAIGIRDITVVQAALFWIALSFLMINLVVDVLYTYIDPRIRFD